MTITKELLNTIYDRAVQYCIAKYGEKIDKITIWEDGGMVGTKYRYSDDSDFDFTVENLTEDLDKVAKLRKEQEEIDAKIYERRVKQKALEMKNQKEAEEKTKIFTIKS